MGVCSLMDISLNDGAIETFKGGIKKANVISVCHSYKNRDKLLEIDASLKIDS